MDAYGEVVFLAPLAVVAGPLLVSGLTSVAIGYLMSQWFGECYTNEDMARDFLIGVASFGVGKVGSIIMKSRALRSAPALYKHFTDGFDPNLMKTGDRVWASIYNTGKGIGGNRKLASWPPFKKLPFKPPIPIPAEFAAKFEPAFSPNMASWWKGFQGQYSYQAPGWKKTVFSLSEAQGQGATGWTVGNIGIRIRGFIESFGDGE